MSPPPPQPAQAVQRIVIVEDDLRLQELLRELLVGSGYEVHTETRGDRAVEIIARVKPELVVLDIGLPGRDGLDVCRELESVYSGRILMLTARSEEIDEILGLELGADDYLAKPVAPRRLLARVKALLRRDQAGDVSELRLGELTIDLTRRQANLTGVALALKTAEFDLLVFMVKHAGTVVSRDDIHKALRGGSHHGLDRSIDLRISRLRKLLGDDPKNPQWIKTVHGAGYLMLGPT